MGTKITPSTERRSGVVNIKHRINNKIVSMYCEAQARVRQGLARDGSQGERPQSFKPCQELTLKLVKNVAFTFLLDINTDIEYIEREMSTDMSSK